MLELRCLPRLAASTGSFAGSIQMSNSRWTDVPVPSTWRTALLKSMAATLACVGVVGIPFLPKEIERQRVKPDILTYECVPMTDGKSIIAQLHDNDNASTAGKFSRRLVLIDLSVDPPASRSLLPDIDPVCFALDLADERLFVGDANGAITNRSIDPEAEWFWPFGRGLKGTQKSISCAADGQTLMVQDETCLYAWNIAEQGALVTPRWCRVDPEISCFAIHPNSQTVLCAQQGLDGDDIAEIDIHTGDRRTVFSQIGRQIDKLLISANGVFLVAVEHKGEVVLLQRPDDQQRWKRFTIPGLRTGESKVATFSPHGPLLITSNQAINRLCVWDLERRELRHQFDERNSSVIGCCFLDADHILSWNLDHKLVVWNLEQAAEEREISFRMNRSW